MYCINAMAPKSWTTFLYLTHNTNPHPNSQKNSFFMPVFVSQYSPSKSHPADQPNGPSRFCSSHITARSDRSIWRQHVFRLCHNVLEVTPRLSRIPSQSCRTRASSMYCAASSYRCEVKVSECENALHSLLSPSRRCMRSLD